MKIHKGMLEIVQAELDIVSAVRCRNRILTGEIKAGDITLAAMDIVIEAAIMKLDAAERAYPEFRQTEELFNYGKSKR